jgi:hypothetical protein
MKLFCCFFKGSISFLEAFNCYVDVTCDDPFGENPSLKIDCSTGVCEIKFQLDVQQYDTKVSIYRGDTSNTTLLNADCLIVIYYDGLSLSL